MEFYKNCNRELKWFGGRCVFLICGMAVCLSSFGQDASHNFIKTETMLSEDGTASMKSVQYFDGLGYPTLSVATADASGNTAYSLTTYDGARRESGKYLPVPSGGCGLDFIGESDVLAKGYGFYNDNSAFTLNHYDAIDRVTAVDIAGDSWRNADKSNTTQYLTNVDEEVLHYEAPEDGSFSLVYPESSSYEYYPAGTLTKVVTTDADGNSVTVFSDLTGCKILERNAVGDTYYVYNSIGQLRFVITPNFKKSRYKAINAYEYRYNDRGLVRKKILPGCEAVEYWYDDADRLMCMRDDVMRKAGLYRFYIYDGLGRLVVQGLCSRCFNDAGSEDVAWFDASASGLCSTGYVASSEVMGFLGDAVLENVNYYDDHECMNMKFFNNLSLEAGCSQMGMLTGAVSRAANGEFVARAMAYDLKGNLTECVSRGLDGRIVTQRTRFSFTGKPVCSDYEVDVCSGFGVSIQDSTVYSRYNDAKVASLLSLSHSGVSSASSSLAYSYDALGRLSSVVRPASEVRYDYDVHGWLTGITTDSFKEVLCYADSKGVFPACYNGNISSMKWWNSNYSLWRGYSFQYDGANRLTYASYGENDFGKNNGRFSERLEYDANGNMTKIERYGLKQDGKYGKIDNLKVGYYGNHISSVEEDALPLYYDGAFDYKCDVDAYCHYKYNGNGSLTADESRGIAWIAYDYNNNPTDIFFSNGNETSYVYSAAGEKLRVIHRTAKPNVVSHDFGTEVTARLTEEQILSCDSTDYLLGGSLTYRNGMPELFLFEGGYCKLDLQEIDCHPLKKSSFWVDDDDSDSSSVTTSSLCKKATLTIEDEEDVDDDSSATATSTATSSATSTATSAASATESSEFTFYYYNQDHLGNIREVVDANGTVQQVTNYYPFGAPFCESASVMNADFQEYKYNGKEFDKMHGLNTYDYGARQHDPLLCRWDRMDPLCEKYYSISPYAYCCNNPVNAVDPDGRDYTLVMNSQDKTMTINATYYAMADDAKFAQSAAESWNANSGQFGYEVNGENYTINFNLNVVSVDNSYPELGPKGEMASLVTKLNSDKSGQANIFRIVSNLPTNVELDNGETADVMGQTNKNYIKVKDGSSIDVAKHEEGHSLGMVHSNSGVMTVATNSSGNSNNPSAGSIKQCIKSAINGKTYDPAAGIGTFINNTGITQEELRKGNVYEIPEH